MSSTSSSKSQQNIPDFILFEMETTKGQDSSSSEDTLNHLQEERCETFFSNVDLMPTPCRSLDENSNSTAVKHDNFSSPIRSKRVIHDVNVQRRGRFLIWPASYGPNATITSSS